MKGQTVISSPQFIVRCLKSDIGSRTPQDLQACIRYAEKIALSAGLNPWADPSTMPNYMTAAQLLREELETTKTETVTA